MTSGKALELSEVAERRLDAAGCAEDRLGDDGGQRADRLPVDQIEADARARVLARREGERERTTVAVGHGDRERARHRRPVPGPAARDERGGAGARRRSVERVREADDLVSPGDLLGDLERRLVGLPPGGQEEDPIQRPRQELDDAPAQRDDLGAQHRAVDVDRPVGRATDGFRDARVIVADGSAHLAGAEIEVLAAVDVRDGGALRPRDHWQREVAGKAADEKLTSLAQELVALAIAHADRSFAARRSSRRRRVASRSTSPSLTTTPYAASAWAVETLSRRTARSTRAGSPSSDSPAPPPPGGR